MTKHLPLLLLAGKTMVSAGETSSEFLFVLRCLKPRNAFQVFDQSESLLWLGWESKTLPCSIQGRIRIQKQTSRENTVSILLHIGHFRLRCLTSNIA